MDIRYLETILSSHTIVSYLSYSDLGDINNIVIVTRQFISKPHPLSSHSLYICHGNKFPLLMKCRENDEPLTVIASGYAKALDAYEGTDGLNLIVTSMELFDLYNNLNQSMFAYHRRLTEIKEAIFDGRDLDQIIAAVASMFEAPVFLLDAGMRIISRDLKYFSREQDPREYICNIVDELSEKGSLSFETVVTKQNTDQLFARNNILYRKIRFNTTVVARLYIILPHDKSIDSLYYAWADEVSAYISKYLKNRQYIPNYYNVRDRFIADIIERKLKTEKEIRGQASLLDLSLPPYYICIAVCPSSHQIRKMPILYVVSQLRGVFPNSTIAFYRNSFIILGHLEKKNEDELQYDLKAFISILNHYDAYAGISYCSQMFAALPVIYSESMTAVRLGRAMQSDDNLTENRQASGSSPLEGDGKNRIFHFSKYHVFQLFELCSTALKLQSINTDLTHLCSPRFLSLLRYDKKNNDNLTDILYTYLCNNCSTTKTARELYMHRNTLLLKIEKAEEILQEDIDNADFQFVLRLSYLITQYVKNILHEDILELPFYYKEKM